MHLVKQISEEVSSKGQLKPVVSTQIMAKHNGVTIHQLRLVGVFFPLQCVALDLITQDQLAVSRDVSHCVHLGKGTAEHVFVLAGWRRYKAQRLRGRQRGGGREEERRKIGRKKEKIKG